MVSSFSFCRSSVSAGLIRDTRLFPFARRIKRNAGHGVINVQRAKLLSICGETNHFVVGKDLRKLVSDLDLLGLNAAQYAITPEDIDQLARFRKFC